jgi:ubiquinone biosynthesis accessory factor UbiJ
MPATPAWLAAIEAALNRGIGQSLRAQAAARRLNGTALELDIEGILRIRAAVQGGVLALTRADERAADAVISGSPFALVERFAGRVDPAPARREERVGMRGDAEIAARYRELLILAHPDWEEELARFVGDLPARRLSLAARSAFAWLRNAGATAARNLAEYLEEESRDLVSRAELSEFIADVDALRETADRVEARLRRIELELQGSA